MPGDVVHATTHCPVITEHVEAFLQLEVEGKVFGEAVRVGFADKLLLVIGHVKGEAGAGFEGICDFGALDPRKFEEGHVAPGEKAIRSVPRIGTGLLRTEDGAVDIEVERLIGAGAGVGVSADESVALTEVAAEGELGGIVTILTGVLWGESAAAGAVERVVDEFVGAAFLQELGFHVDGGGKLPLEANAPVQETGSLEIKSVGGETCGDGAGDLDSGTAENIRYASGIDGVEGILARSGEGTGDEKDWSGVVDDADSGR